MGEVHQATDTKLNRQVALEILPRRLPKILTGSHGFNAKRRHNTA